MAEKREKTHESEKARVESDSPKRARKEGPLAPRENLHARQVQAFRLRDEEFHHMDEAEISFDDYYEHVAEENETDDAEATCGSRRFPTRTSARCSSWVRKQA